MQFAGAPGFLNWFDSNGLFSIGSERPIRAREESSPSSTAPTSWRPGQRAKARLSINVWIEHAGAFGNQYFSELVLFVQRVSQF